MTASLLTSCNKLERPGHEKRKLRLGSLRSFNHNNTSLSLHSWATSTTPILVTFRAATSKSHAATPGCNQDAHDLTLDVWLAISKCITEKVRGYFTWHLLPKISTFCALSQNNQQLFKKWIMHLIKRLFKGLKNGIEILVVGQAVLELLIQTQHLTVWSVT